MLVPPFSHRGTTYVTFYNLVFCTTKPFQGGDELLKERLFWDYSLKERTRAAMGANCLLKSRSLLTSSDPI